jgi:RNA polymerase sigma-70 factor (ECF subfamily)
MMPEPDRRLTIKVMDRQQEIMAEFVAARHSLFAYILGFVRNPHDAEDLFQEVWLRLSGALAEGRDIQDQAKWCRGTARNLILHYWRDRRQDKVIADQELFDLVELAFAEQVTHEDFWRSRREALNECVQELPERSRHLLRLKYEQGLSADQVGDQLQQSGAAVLMSLSRLRRLLRDCARKKLGIQGLRI